MWPSLLLFYISITEKSKPSFFKRKIFNSIRCLLFVCIVHLLFFPFSISPLSSHFLPAPHILSISLPSIPFHSKNVCIRIPTWSASISSFVRFPLAMSEKSMFPFLRQLPSSISSCIEQRQEISTTNVSPLSTLPPLIFASIKIIVYTRWILWDTLYGYETLVCLHFEAWVVWESSSFLLHVYIKCRRPGCLSPLKISDTRQIYCDSHVTTQTKASQ